METSVKHRVVGSLMLVSLAVIILPFFLGGEGIQAYQASQKAPPIPVQDDREALSLNNDDFFIDSIDPSDTQVIELSPVIEPVLDEASTVSKTDGSESTQGLLNSQGLPNGWVVQLGSFGNQANAIRLKDKVIKAGYPGYIIPAQGLFKVMVGPEINRAKAETLQKDLKAQFKLQGMVTLYDIARP